MHTRTPGSNIRAITWDWGDGSRDHLAGDQVRVARTHDYRSVGTYRVTVTIEDETGARGSAELRTHARVLTVVHRPLAGMHSWSVCDRAGVHELHFLVRSDDVPVSGAEVEVSGAGWATRGVSDAGGEARVTVRREDGWLPPLMTGRLTIGRLGVTARSTGHTESQVRYLALLDCEGTAITITGELVRSFADLVEKGRDIEARGPRAASSNQPPRADVFAILAPLIRAIETGRASPLIAQLFGVTDEIELEARIMVTLKTLHQEMQADQAVGDAVFVGPMPAAPVRFDDDGPGPDPGLSTGWLIERKDGGGRP